MKFKKGNKAAKGGRRTPSGGRPSKEQVALKRLAAENTKKYIEGKLKTIVDAYISLATGQRCGNSRKKLDPATCRHAIERFLGPAPRTLTLDLAETVESFYEHVQKEDGEQGKPEEKEGDR